MSVDSNPRRKRGKEEGGSAAWRRREEVAEEPRLPSVAEAQKTRLVRRAAFLSAAEVSELLCALEGMPLEQHSNPEDNVGGGDRYTHRWCCLFVFGVANDFVCACSTRPAHTTAYVQTGGAFGRLFPALRRRVLGLAAEVDQQEGWGVCAATAKGQLRTGVAVRCAEFHRMV